jgi:hypothetical protein
MMCPELATILEGDGGTRDNSGDPALRFPQLSSWVTNVWRFGDNGDSFEIRTRK